MVLAVPPLAAEALALSWEGALPAGELHLTLAYLGKVGEVPFTKSGVLLEVERFARRHLPLTAKINGLGRFQNATEEDAIFAIADNPALPAFRQELVEQLESGGIPVDHSHGFVPHITLAYVPAGSEAPAADVVGVEIPFVAVDLWWAGERIRLGLTAGQKREKEVRMSKSKKQRGESLASLLNGAVEKMVSGSNGEKERADVVAAMAEAAGIASGTVNEILQGTIKCPPLQRLQGFADVLPLSLDEVVSAAEQDGCSYTEERAMGLLQRVVRELKAIFAPAPVGTKARTVKDVDSWDGSPSRWPDTASYCDDCLIDVNEAAGRDEPVQNHCFLPIREPGDGDDVVVRQAVFAAAGGRGISRVKKPDDVAQEAWDTAVEQAANEIIDAYDEMEMVAPAAVYELAGKEVPAAQRALALGLMHEQVWQELFDSNQGWLLDVYYDRGQFFAVAVNEGRLYRAPLEVEDDQVRIGEFVAVTQQFVPVPARARVQVFRDISGRRRWLAVSASAVLNRVGEIDSRELFDSFVRRAQETGKFPVLNFWHLYGGFQEPLIRLGQADFLARDGYLYVTSGLFDETPIGEAAAAGLAREPDYWGHSIEFVPSRVEMVEVMQDVRVPAYLEGENTGIALVSEQMAASLMTGQMINRKVTAMNEKVLAELRRLVGPDNEELVDEFANMVDVRNRTVMDQGLIARAVGLGAEAESEEEEAEGKEAGTEAPGTVEEFELDEGMMDQLAEMVTAKLATRSTVVEQLQNGVQQLVNRLNEAAGANRKKFEAIERRLAALEKPEQERQKQWSQDLPARPAVRFTYRPSANNGGSNGAANGVGDMEALAEATLSKWNS